LTLKPARVLNIAANLMIQEEKPENRELLFQELHGRFRTIGRPLPPGDEHAPAWWQGDEEAFALAQAVMSRMGRSRR
jgi:hypothetical protein